MKDITKEERNTCIIITCDYFKTRGIHLVPDMFIETEDDDHKFLMQDAWLEYTLDIEDLSINYTVSMYTQGEPDCFVLSITNNGGLEHTDEYQTFCIPFHQLHQCIKLNYRSDIEQNPIFKKWI